MPGVCGWVRCLPIVPVCASRGSGLGFFGPRIAAPGLPASTPRFTRKRQNARTLDSLRLIVEAPLTPQQVNVSYSYFYDSLSPYGNWIQVDGYGLCWQPTVVVVNREWSPYGDHGHWVYSDYGWYWVSDYSWGWAPFHYGRWFRHVRWGWCWASTRPPATTKGSSRSRPAPCGSRTAPATVCSRAKAGSDRQRTQGFQNFYQRLWRLKPSCIDFNKVRAGCTGGRKMIATLDRELDRVGRRVVLRRAGLKLSWGLVAIIGEAALSAEDRRYLAFADRFEQEIGRIHLDAVYSPVTRVRYTTENTRVGQRTNYDRLILEIWTNGTISPEMALVEAAKILRKHINPFVQYFELGEETVSGAVPQEEPEKKVDEELEAKLNTPIQELELSVRASNCLESVKVETVRQLVQMTEADLLKIRSFGKTSLREIKRKLADIGLSLGMKDVGQ